MAIKRVPIAGGALEVSQLGLGCMGFSGLLGRADDATSIAVIQRALDAGINFLDTSTSYGMGHNQEIIGKALAGRRDQVVVHSKFGVKRDADGKPLGTRADPATVREDCEASLKRFGFEAIDIWCPSRIDNDVPVEETVGAIAELIAEGKVRHIGLSEASADTVRRANKVHPVATLQFEYSLFTRDAEQGNLAACREHGMGLMAYGPLGRGMLGKVFNTPSEIGATDNRKTQPRFQPGNFERNMALVEAVDEIADEKGCTTVQVALAWLMAQGDDVIPIPGSRTPEHLDENIGAAEVTLALDELARLDALFPPDAAVGTRYPESEMHWVNR